MPDPTLLPKLVVRLQDLTTEGKIDWQETANENAFQATVGQFVVTIHREKANWDDWDYHISVVDLKGTLIDEAWAGHTTLAKLKPDYGLFHLYDGARRKAINADKALSDLLSSLDLLSR
jgi:hypothetical protein